MDDFNWALYLSALLTGLLFGYVLQRGGFCLTRALSNAVLMGDTTILRAYVLALLVAMIGVHTLMALGLIEVPIRPFRWVANILGGGLFGVGMILSGGCSGSTWYRVGEGAIGACVVLLGFAMGATTVSVGVLAPVRTWLQAPAVTLGGAAPTLHGLVGVSPWVVIAVLAASAAVWLARPLLCQLSPGRRRGARGDVETRARGRGCRRGGGPRGAGGPRLSGAAPPASRSRPTRVTCSPTRSSDTRPRSPGAW